ncbi:MAG: ATP-dependent DNA ligase [Chloroflexota bacterium]|nr:ATP-dependent DNA ligase [Chloroflexota bacterium]
MTFRELAEVFERIDAVSGRNAMIEILAELYQRVTPEEAAQVTYLMQGRLVPKFVDLEFGMASRLLLRSIAQAFEAEADVIQSVFREAGDLGLAAEALTPSESIAATPLPPRGWGLTRSGQPVRLAQRRRFGQGRIYWHTAVGQPSWWSRRQRELAQDWARDVSVGGVFARLREVAEAEGAESQERKVAGIAALLRDLDPRSNRYLPRIPVGRLRLGIGDPTFMDALSFARLGDKSDRKAIERAYNLTCDLGQTARDYLRGGADAMDRARVRVGNPVRMAQAARMSSGQEIVDKIGSAAVEPKLDGFRVQIHRDGDRVRIYSRNLEDMSRMFPDVSQAARARLKKPQVIIEGEAMGVNPETGEFLPFQVTTSRRRRHGIEAAAKEIPLHVHAFDLLYDGDNVIELPFTERRRRLEEIVEDDGDDLQVSECIITDDPEAIDVFFNEQVHAGFEGVMAKRLDSVYQAGQRNFNWIKYKASYSSALTDTLDCVLIGYWRGQGKRAPWGIGALLSAVWDADEQVFKSIARIGTGYSDEEWVRIREKLDEIALAERPDNVHSDVVPDVWASPEIVVEVLADELTRSPMHVAGRTDDELGLALRFPRVIGFVRDDKAPADATTVAEVRDLFARQGGSS